MLAANAQIGSDQSWTDSVSYTSLILFVVFFMLLLIICIIICVLCARRRSKNSIPIDEGEDGEGGDAAGPGEWTDWFDALFNANRTKTPKVETLHGMLHVPVDMALNICGEENIEVQQLLRDEFAERLDILRAEDFVADRLDAAFASEIGEVQQHVTTAERTSLMNGVITFWEQEYYVFADVEEEARDLIEALADEERLMMAEMERAAWRDAMDVQEALLHRTLQNEERWRSRKRRLMESSSHLMSHIDAGAHHVTPMHADAQGGGRLLAPPRSYGAGVSPARGNALTPLNNPPRASAMDASRSEQPVASHPLRYTPDLHATRVVTPSDVSPMHRTPYVNSSRRQQPYESPGEQMPNQVPGSPGWR
jgi:hypothetical protein